MPLLVRLANKLKGLWYPTVWLVIALFVIGMDSVAGSMPFSKGYHWFLAACIMGGLIGWAMNRREMRESIKRYDNEFEELRDLNKWKDELKEDLKNHRAIMFEKVTGFKLHEEDRDTGLPKSS